MEEKIKSRSEVPEELTWDLTRLYATEEKLLADVSRMEQMASEISRQFRGKLTSAKQVNDCLTAYAKLRVLMYWTGCYTDLAVSVDYYNSYNQKLNGRICRANAQIYSEMSFIDSELSELDEKLIEEAIAYDNGNSEYLRRILRNKQHRLHPEAERVVAALSQTISAPMDIYNNIKLADIQFDGFTANGKEYPLSYSLFEEGYEYDPDTEIRRGAFQAFQETLRKYENGTAAAYNVQVQTEKTQANLRGFDSVFDYLLFGQNVSRELYHRQIDIIMEKLAPYMRKYAKLIAKVYKLDHMTYADLKLPIDVEYAPDVTLEEAKKYVEDGLAVLGEDYVEMIQSAYRERWIDFAQNKGKSTGGFCASPYRKGSYILLNWNGKMPDVFTLAHELGHAGHFKLCDEKQSIFDIEVSNYFVESPSTMNELLMAHYMLKTSDDKRFRRWVLSNMIGNTYYHNFVTHLLEAAYQREVYRRVDAGERMQAETLNEIMKDTLQKFWADTVDLNKGAELTWMRQPHYYMGLYSYTYSAGLTIATLMCKRIEKEGAPAVEDWKKVLGMGGKVNPVEFAALAGIDITTDAALNETVEIIGSIIDEICDLTEEIETESKKIG